MPYYTQNSTIQQGVLISSTEPTTAKEGALYYDTITDSLYVYVNGQWVIAVVGVGTDGPFDFMDGQDFQYMDGNSAGFMTG